jgi:hypothetical protein
MALAHILRLLKKFFRNVADGIDEASEMRRKMARRHPHMEE